MLIHDAAGATRPGSVPLVWHQARRRACDPAHTTGRIQEGLRMWVGVGIDIHPMSDGHFAVLGGPALDGETTGAGPVVRTRAADLDRLRRRAPDGTALAEAPTTLAALADLIRPAPAGDLHITLRCGDEALRPGHEVGLARALRPLTGRVLLSGRDATALRRLGDAAPGLRLGLVLADETAEWLRRTGDARTFAERVIEAMPEAGSVHLSGRAILALDDEDIGLVGAFRARGWQVEAQTGDGSETGLWDVLRLVSLGVDRIATGDAEGLLAAMSGRHPPGHRGQPWPVQDASSDRPVGSGWGATQPRSAA